MIRHVLYIIYMFVFLLLTVSLFNHIQGIVKTMKDSFGFIERADVAKDVSLIKQFLFWFIFPSLQIFFHYSELSTGSEASIQIGSPVEFVIQNRQVMG